MVASSASRPMQANPIAGVIAIAAIERKEFDGRRNGAATKSASLTEQRVWTARRETRALRRRKNGFCDGLQSRVSENEDGRSVAITSVKRRKGRGSKRARRRKRAQRGREHHRQMAKEMKKRSQEEKRNTKIRSSMREGDTRRMMEARSWKRNEGYLIE